MILITSVVIESRTDKFLSEIECQDDIDKIQSQAEMITQFKGMIESLQKILDTQALKDLKQQELIANLTAEVAKLNDYNQRHNKFSFG